MSDAIALVVLLAILILTLVGLDSVITKFECDIETGKICAIVAVPEKGE